MVLKNKHEDRVARWIAQALAPPAGLSSAEKLAEKATKSSQVPSNRGHLDDQAGSLIAPGGCWARAEDGGPADPSNRKHFLKPRDGAGTSYADHFKGRLPEGCSWEDILPPMIQGPKGSASVEPGGTTHRVGFVLEKDDWRQECKSTYVTGQVAADTLMDASRSNRKRNERGGFTERGRSDQEMRWQRYMKRQMREQKRCQGVTPSLISGTTTCKTVSSIPAGLRPAKTLNQHAPDGQVLPLFGDDKPTPIWTNMSFAPWVGKVSPTRSKDPTPWLDVEEPDHPLKSFSRAPRPPPAAIGSARSSCSSSRPVAVAEAVVSKPTATATAAAPPPTATATAAAPPIATATATATASPPSAPAAAAPNLMTEDGKGSKAKATLPVPSIPWALWGGEAPQSTTAKAYSRNVLSLITPRLPSVKTKQKT